MSKSMKVLVGALLAAGVVASAGAANPIKPMQTASTSRCDALIAQFDSAKASHSSAKGYPQAANERETGAAQCKSGNVAKGEQTLAKALKDIGVKPVAA